MSVDTLVSSVSSPASGSHTRCRVAILGFGTVGSAIAARLGGLDPVDGLELTHILDRRAFAKRARLGDQCARACWTTQIDDILSSDVDIVVEAIGGIEPAAEWIRRALKAGKSVVTANKQVIAQHGPSLLALAERQGRQLRFEAAVGGAMPIVRAISDGLAGDRLIRIVAILNGTSNAVLSRMDATGCTLPRALTEAQASGWAEADPASDLDGLDARAKLTILCALGFGLRIEPSGIEARSAAGVLPDHFARARRRGGTIRQLAFAEYDRARSRLAAWVAPAVVSRASIFGRTVGPGNAAMITGEHAGRVGVIGVGAGGAATAVAVIGDLLTIARDRAAIVPARILSAPAVVTGLTSRTELDGRIDVDGRTEIVDLLDSRVVEPLESQHLSGPGVQPPTRKSGLAGDVGPEPSAAGPGARGVVEAL
jgi:homoserine dehydrogenase